MSFFNITDPQKREQIFKEYHEMRKRFRENEEDNRSELKQNAIALEKRYAPIVKSQKKMSEDIVKELRDQRANTEYFPVKKEQTKQTFSPVKKEKKGNKVEENLGNLAEDYRNRYALHDPDLDLAFGIRFLANGQAVIGNTPITLENNDIIIRQNVYDGTEGLWNLLVERTKDQLSGYDETDLQNYKEILRQTAVLHQDFDPDNPRPRSSHGYKWRAILSKIWADMKKENNSDTDDEFMTE